MKAYILTGLIGSGKSTKARDIKSKLDNCVIISKDSLRTMIHGEYLFDVKYEKLIKKLNKEIIIDSLISEFNVIIDETHLTKKSRKDIVNFLKIGIFGNIDITIVHCTENKNNVENRKKHDLRGYTVKKWKEVLQKHLSIYEPATQKECDELGIKYEEWVLIQV